MEQESLRHQILLLGRHYFAHSSQARNDFIPGLTYIPPAKQCLNDEDLLGLLETSMDFQFAGGARVREFETRLGNKFFPHHSRPLMVNSGSSANLVAISTLGSPKLRDIGYRPLEKGDEVITVAAGFPTTVSPIIQNGWVPVFVDVDYMTLNATLQAIVSAHTDKTRAVVLAHTLGNPYRADQIRTYCQKEKLYLIEDCCDALGAKINGMRVGDFGDLSTLSFYPAHHISTGEGGAVIAKNPKFRKMAASLRDWGRDCWCEPNKDNTCGKRFCWQMGELPLGYDHKYIYTHFGYNLKGTEMEASLGLTQLAKADYFIEKRQQNWDLLNKGILSSKILNDYLCPVRATQNTEPSWFGFAVHCEEPINRTQLTQFLEAHKVGTRLLFGGNLTKQPCYYGAHYRISEDLVNTDDIMDDTFWMGLHPGIDERHINYMLEQLEAGIREQL